MRARDDVREKALGMVELGLLPSYSRQMFFDDRCSFGLASVKYQANVGQADAYALTGSQHLQSSYMFLAVVAVARR